MFWENFWPNFFANLIVDGLIVGVVFFVLERYFNTKDRKVEEENREKQRKENLHITVNMLWAEIEHNRIQIYPALETSAWEVIDRKQIFEGLKPKDFSNLLKIYNRVYTVNRMYYQMLDKIEWILLGTDSTVRREYIDGIISRSKELLDYIEEVIPSNLAERKNKQ